MHMLLIFHNCRETIYSPYFQHCWATCTIYKKTFISEHEMISGSAIFLFMVFVIGTIMIVIFSGDKKDEELLERDGATGER